MKYLKYLLWPFVILFLIIGYIGVGFVWVGEKIIYEMDL